MTVYFLTNTTLSSARRARSHLYCRHSRRCYDVVMMNFLVNNCGLGIRIEHLRLRVDRLWIGLRIGADRNTRYCNLYASINWRANGLS